METYHTIFLAVTKKKKRKDLYTPCAKPDGLRITLFNYFFFFSASGIRYLLGFFCQAHVWSTVIM